MTNVDRPDVTKPDVAPPNYQEAAEQYFAEFLGKHWWTEMLAYFFNSLVYGVITVIGVAIKLIDVMLAALVKLIGSAKQTQSPEFLELVVSIVNYILGLNVDPTAIERTNADYGNLDVRDRLGGLLLGAFITDFTTAADAGALGSGISGDSSAAPLPFGQQMVSTAGATAARRHLGRMIQSSVAAGNTALLTEMASLGILDTAKEYADNLKQNLAFSRMTRIAIAPLFQVLIGDPLKAELNFKYRPHQLSAGETVQGFIRGHMSRADLDIILGRMGHSAEAINLLIDAARPQASVSELARTWQYKQQTREQIKAAIVARGILDADAEMMINNILDTAVDSRVNTFITTIMSLAENRLIGTDQLNTLIDPLPIFDDEKTWIRKIVGLKLDADLQDFTLAQVKELYLALRIDLTDVDAWFDRQNYRLDVRKALRLDLLLTQADQSQKALSAAADAAAKAHAAADAAAAKAQQDAALTLGSTGKPLTFAQVEAQYVAGRLTDDQYKTFLSNYGYSGVPLELEFQDAKAKRTAAEDKAAKAGTIVGGSAAPALTLSQIESAYVDRIISQDEFISRVLDLGYSNDDATIIAADAANKLATADAQRAGAGTLPPGTPKPKLTASQGEAAYIGGIYTREDLEELLGLLGYIGDSLDTFMQLADEKKAKADATAAAAEAKKNAQPASKLTTAQQVAAYVADEITRAQLQSYLANNGYTASDQAIILEDADNKHAARLAAIAAGQVVPPGPAAKTLSLSEETDAFIADQVTAAAFRDYLSAAGYSAGDVDILVNLATAKKKTTTGGSTPATPSTPATKEKLLSFAQIEKAYLLDVITLEAAMSDLAALGYGTRELPVLQQTLLILKTNKSAEQPPAGQN